VGNKIDWEIDDAYQAAFDPVEVTAAVERILQLEGKTHASLTVAITDEVTIQALNYQFRGVDAPTDVLSFAQAENDTPDSPSLVLPAEFAAEFANYLGDIVIALPYAERQAAHYGNSLIGELRLLAVHGTLHLLGYDHATAEEEAVMWAKQVQALAPSGDDALAHRVYQL
jgi:probable rRNA maturation factor